jgi:NAD(P)-dependent dehydrogenase (short-subunit alcohol dehydrogenase family)
VDLGVRGKGFLIVGGTSGMGLATASVLAAEGAQLALVGRDAARAAEVAQRMSDEHGTLVVPVPGDVSRAGEGDRVVAAAQEFLADLAGVAVLTGTEGHVSIEAEDDVWTDAFEDVVMGTVRTVRAVLPHLVARGGGTVVTTAAYSIRSPHDNRLPYGTF